MVNLAFSVVLLLLVLMSGDVSENPGPDLESISTVTGNTCSLSILHLNIRSIRNKINYIEENFNDFDILCFTETHLGDTVSNDDIYIEGFHLVSYRKDVSPHSSGILVYVSQGLATIRKPELECHLEESLWIENFHRGESILLSTIYRPPNTPVSFWNRLNIVTEKSMEISSNLIIVGDLNEDQLNPRNHYLKDVMTLNNLLNVIVFPTRKTAQSETLLDQIVVHYLMKVFFILVLLMLTTGYLIIPLHTFTSLLHTIMTIHIKEWFGFMIGEIWKN